MQWKVKDVIATFDITVEGFVESAIAESLMMAALST
jgi:hypothetical protein